MSPKTGNAAALLFLDNGEDERLLIGSGPNAPGL